MIVVEGPDGCGKTTLAHKICDKFDLEYRRPPRGVLSSESGPLDSEGLMAWWLAELKRPWVEKHGGVYDRTTFISDVIYRLVTGGVPGGTPFEMSRGIVHLINYGLTIFCLPSWAEVEAILRDSSRPFNEYLNVHTEDKEAAADALNKLRTIHWAYECQYHLYKEASFDRILWYDWHNEKHIMEEVEEYLA